MDGLRVLLQSKVVIIAEAISNGNNTGGLVGGNEGILTVENSYNEGIIVNNLGHNIGGILGRDNTEANITTINLPT